MSHFSSSSLSLSSLSLPQWSGSARPFCSCTPGQPGGLSLICLTRSAWLTDLRTRSRLMGKPDLHSTTLDLHYHNPDESKIKSAFREAQAQIQRERERDAGWEFLVVLVDYLFFSRCGSVVLLASGFFSWRCVGMDGLIDTICLLYR